MGSKVNSQCEDGMTALHKSVWIESKEVFEKLLSQGADPDIKDNDGESVRDLVKDMPDFRKILDDSDKDQLAISMRLSEYERQQLNKKSSGEITS